MCRKLGEDENKRVKESSRERATLGQIMSVLHAYYASHVKRINAPITSLITSRALSQYPKRRLFVRSRKVSKPRDLHLELSGRSEIWQALWQHCCRCACQISKRYDNLKYQSRGFETLRNLTKRRLFGYWDGAQTLWFRIAFQAAIFCSVQCIALFYISPCSCNYWSRNNSNRGSIEKPMKLMMD